MEGTDTPLPGDHVQRIGNLTDKNRQGLIYFTSSDDYAPYIDILDGVTDHQFREGNTKVRLGNLRGLRVNGQQLDEYGIYINGGIFQHSTYYMEDGSTLEQQFSILNGRLDSTIQEIRQDMSNEEGNILRNSSFSVNLHYWGLAPVVHFINVGGGFLWLPSAYYVDKRQVADIYRDGSRNVLRILSSSITQSNDIMRVPEHAVDEETGQKILRTYSFSLFVKTIRPGTLSVGVPGTDLYLTEQLTAGENGEYTRITHEALWNGEGDFEIRCDGEVFIYGLTLMQDGMADALIKLETEIEQTSEYIKLLATKEYVDSETGKVYTKYDAELKVQAEAITQRVTKTEYDTWSGQMKEQLEGKITTEAGRITAVASRISSVERTIESAGWITSYEGNQLWAKKEMENGSTIVSTINQTAEWIKISASHVDITGAVTFDSFSQSLKNTINGKANSSDLGDLAKLDSVELAQLGTTIIEGGHIKTSLIDADKINVTKINAISGTIGSFNIGNSSISASISGGSMSLTPSGGLYYNWDGMYAGIGPGSVSAASGSRSMLYTRATGSNDFAAIFEGKTYAKGTLEAQSYQVRSGSTTYNGVTQVNRRLEDYYVDIRGGIITKMTAR